jgi:hypothetical protein
MMGAIFMKFGLAPATSIIFMKESLWIGIESITTTGNEASPGIESISLTGTFY